LQQSKEASAAPYPAPLSIWDGGFIPLQAFHLPTEALIYNFTEFICVIVRYSF
jgi:hypothetical protein